MLILFSFTADKLYFINEMESCRYVIRWDTPSLCQPLAKSSDHHGSSGVGGSGLTSGAVAGIVICVLIAIVIVTVLVVIIRRRRLRSWNEVYEYSGLNADDDTSLLVSSSRGPAPRRYDDDDDDLII